MLFLFLSAVAWNSKSNRQLEPKHHRTRDKERTHSKANGQLEQRQHRTRGKKRVICEHISLQSPQAHTQTGLTFICETEFVPYIGG